VARGGAALVELVRQRRQSPKFITRGETGGVIELRLDDASAKKCRDPGLQNLKA
jgi:hypothetical protein